MTETNSELTKLFNDIERGEITAAQALEKISLAKPKNKRGRPKRATVNPPKTRPRGRPKKDLADNPLLKVVFMWLVYDCVKLSQMEKRRQIQLKTGLSQATISNGVTIAKRAIKMGAVWRSETGDWIIASDSEIESLIFRERFVLPVFGSN